ncbi:protein app1-like [Vanessa atalanta]|uniref:protein app1-like n=1 Tax=Vanessa atalanta TaxID=42275 RepID=UPI001FCCFA21|nr:protein app1-like [Vanessa atalanta]
MATDKIKRIICFGFLYLIFLVETSYCLNLGLISGDLKRSSSPLIIRKTSHHSPITINIRPGTLKPQKLLPPILPPLLSLKSPTVKTKIKHPTLIKLPKVPILPKLPKIPWIPKLPLLPIIPPILPPLIPKLPLPILPILPPLLPPILPGLTKLSKPIRVPIIGKTKLQKALGSQLKPFKVNLNKSKLNKNILEKLLKLKKDGSLTTSQFIRFKKLLL